VFYFSILAFSDSLPGLLLLLAGDDSHEERIKKSVGFANWKKKPKNLPAESKIKTIQPQGRSEQTVSLKNGRN